MTDQVFPVPDRDSLRHRLIMAGNACLEILRIGEAAEIIVRIYKSKRTKEQNGMLHGICGCIAKQKPWAGRTLDTEGWKRLIVEAWLKETGRRIGDVVPSLDYQSVVVLNRSTAQMDAEELSELIEWALAFCATEGVDVKYKGRDKP